MTTTLTNLELIADWLKENVCPYLQYKRPNDDNNDGTYNYQLINPDVHIMYIPPKDILPEKKYAAPSILVQYDNNKNFPKERNGLINIRLGFSIWNPGLHAQDKYERNAEGYRDVLNFVQYVEDALIKEELIGPIRIRLEDGIETGPIKEQGVIADFYPYWFAYLTFTGEFGKTSIHKKYDHLL